MKITIVKELLWSNCVEIPRLVQPIVFFCERNAIICLGVRNQTGTRPGGVKPPEKYLGVLGVAWNNLFVQKTERVGIQFSEGGQNFLI